MDSVRALGLGFNVLVPELRGHPPSTGARITYGLLETGDLLRLLDLAEARFGVARARLGIDGCSMGALLAVHLAAASPPAALWLQAPFGDLVAMAAHYLHCATSLPAFLFALPVRVLMRRIARTEGLDLSQVDPVRAARRVTCPAVVVHGENDDLVPIRFSTDLYEALAGAEVVLARAALRPLPPRGRAPGRGARRIREALDGVLPPARGVKPRTFPRP